jgi:hypothetical protein
MKKRHSKKKEWREFSAATSIVETVGRDDPVLTVMTEFQSWSNPTTLFYIVKLIAELTLTKVIPMAFRSLNTEQNDNLIFDHLYLAKQKLLAL